MKKITLKTLLALACMMCSWGAMAHDFVVDGIYYLILNEDDLTVAVTFRGNAFDSYDDEYSGKVVIPNTANFNENDYSVIAVYNEAFRQCTGVTEVVMGENVSIIGNKAFFNCINMASINFPEALTYIGSQAFVNCHALTSIELGDNITTIDFYAFSACTGLTSIEIPAGITAVSEYVFSACTGLTEVTIPENITEIGACAFSSCSSLQSVTITDNVASIGIMAFASCPELTTVKLGSGITYIDDYAFDNSLAVRELHCTATKPPVIHEMTFSADIYDTATLHVVTGCKEAYAKANYWKAFTNITDDLSGINSVKCDGTAIMAVNGQLVINGIEDNAVVNVYSVTGALVYQTIVANAAQCTLPAGMYIVQAGDVVAKVVL